MLASYSRKLLMAAMLVAALAAPAAAGDGMAMMQMAQSGQSAADLTAIDSSPSVAQEGAQVPTKTSLAFPNAQQGAGELRATKVSLRQASPGIYRHAERPLILGIGY